MAWRTYEIYKENQPAIVKEPYPEYIGANRGLFPDETRVLVGFYKSEEHLNWILKHRLYNVRTGTRTGSLQLDTALIAARYLLLHTTGGLHMARLYRIVPGGPRLYSQHDLLKKHYPASEKETVKEHFYLVYSISEVEEPELRDRTWDVAHLSGYEGGRMSARPFVVTLEELMKG